MGEGSVHKHKQRCLCVGLRDDRWLQVQRFSVHLEGAAYGSFSPTFE